MSVRRFNDLNGNEVNVVLGHVVRFSEVEGGVALSLTDGSTLNVASSARSVRGYVNKALGGSEAE